MMESSLLSDAPGGAGGSTRVGRALAALVVVVLVGCLCGIGMSAAQEKAETEKDPQFPGIAELVPRYSELIEQASVATKNLQELEDTARIKARIEEIKSEVQSTATKIGVLDQIAKWNTDRLLGFRDRLSRQKDASEKQLQALSERLASLEKEAQTWNAVRRFWKDWLAFLRAEKAEFPADTFRKAQETTDRLLEDLSKASGPLLAMQKELIQQKEESSRLIGQMDQALSGIRQEVFRKNARSFANKEFYGQFTGDLWAALKQGLIRSLELDPGFFSRQGWLALVQILLVVGMALFVTKQRDRAKETPEWAYVLGHPWATGIFTSVACLSWLYHDPPALWRLLLWVLAAASFSVLISGLVRNPLKRLTIYLLAALFVLSLFLKIMALPLPLYRIYVALVSLLGLLLILMVSRKSLREQTQKTSGFLVTLRMGALTLGVTLLAQVAGYTALSFHLIESSVTSVFIVLLAAMVVRLGRGAIDYFLVHSVAVRKQLARSLTNELSVKLKNILRVVVVAWTAFYLLLLWGAYDSVKQTWTRLIGVTVSLGEVRITLGMILFAGVVIYATILLSLALRAFLESKVFPRQQFDRGVRDAISKLLHYFLIFIGFLLAMSLAGIEMKNFAVLAGAFGIGIGFGLQNIVNNFVSGIILLFERPIKIGDLLVLDGEWGTVKRIGLRSTIIETLDQSEIIVPNSQIIQEKVTNWTLSTSISRVVVPVGVAYGSNVPLVLRVLLEAGGNHPLTLPEPKPSAIFIGFGQSSLDFELRLWVGDVTQRLVVRSELLQTIDQRFREEGVEIPFPQRDLHLRSVDTAAGEDLGLGPGKTGGPERA